MDNYQSRSGTTAPPKCTPYYHLTHRDLFTTQPHITNSTPVQHSSITLDEATSDERHYFIYNRVNNKVSRCRMADFTVYNPHNDPICTTLPSSYHVHASTVFTEPKNIKQARQAPDASQWEIAWNNELDSLEARGVLTFIPKSNIPSDTKLLPVTTVLKLKKDNNGEPTLRKVRCTIRGDQQESGIHYDPHDLSSPVASRDEIRSALALAAAHDYHTFHWDLESAFLHELFTEDRSIFIHQPRRFDGTHKYPNHVAKLTDNMYGSRQACKIFTEGLADFLSLSQFSGLASDTCSFILNSHKNPSRFVLLVITVDDFLVITNHTPLTEKVKARLQQKKFIERPRPSTTPTCVESHAQKRWHNHLTAKLHPSTH